MDLHLLSNVLLAVAASALLIVGYILGVLTRNVREDSSASDSIEQSLLDFLHDLSQRARASREEPSI